MRPQLTADGAPSVRSRRIALAATLLAIASLLTAALLATTAQAAVGVISVSRGAGAPGEEVRLTLGCGFCYPPCKGPEGERHPAGFEHGPCMLGTHGAEPPRSFEISLVPLARAPEPHPCGPNATCTPQASAPPRHAPFRYLGAAIPPAQGNDPAKGVPRYQLGVTIPDLPPGLYTYVIYCDACLQGKGGSLIAVPGARPWRLRVLGPKVKRSEPATPNGLRRSSDSRHLG